MPEKKVYKDTGYTFKGEPIQLMKSPGPKFKGLVAKGMAQGNYPVSVQQQAALLYAVTGSLELASEKSGVPIPIIKNWSREPWFGIILQEFRHENLAKLDAAFTDVIDLAVKEIKERIENGDYHVTRNGQVVRSPVSMRDLAIVQAINIDKRELLRGNPTSRSESQKADPEELLNQLADTFSRVLDKKRKPVTLENTEDAIIIESPSQLNGGGVAQPELRQESGSPSECRA